MVVASFLSATPLMLECLVSPAPVSICLRFKAILSSLPIDFAQPLTTLVLSRKRNTVVIRQPHVHFKCLAMLPAHKVWLKGHLKWPMDSYFACMKASSWCFLPTQQRSSHTWHGNCQEAPSSLWLPLARPLPLRKAQLLECCCRACGVGPVLKSYIQPWHVMLCLGILP